MYKLKSLLRLACCLTLVVLTLSTASNAQNAGGDEKEHAGEHGSQRDGDQNRQDGGTPVNQVDSNPDDDDSAVSGSVQVPGSSEGEQGHSGRKMHQASPEGCGEGAPPSETPLENIRIGVLSPISGSLSSVGSPHEESIKLAHRAYGRVVRVGEVLVEIELVKRDYRTDADEAVRMARELVDQNEVVALIGPVNSRAVEEVVKELKGDHVAVLSALATAPSLTSKSGHNFFRVVFDDNTRMKQYATFIKRQKISGTFRVLFDESSTYGIELCESFKQHFKTGDIQYQSWGSFATDEPASDDCRFVKPGAMKLKRNYDEWIAEFDISVKSNSNDYAEQFNHIAAAVLLGSTKGALDITDRLSRLKKPPKFFLVGSSREMFGRAPEGAFTIGDPKLDPYYAETSEEGARWTRLLRTYERQHFQTRDDFIPTAYDAYVAIHEALEITLNRRYNADRLGNRLRPECLRVELLNTLKNETFNSITSWRKVSFDSRGSLEEDPVAPVYRIRRDAVRADPEGTHDWVEVKVDPNQRMYWGPVSVTLKPHGALAGVSSVLYLMREGLDGLEEVVEQRLITFAAGPVVEDFYFLPNARYFLRMSSDYNPANPEFEVKLTEDYFVAFIVAILAGLLVAQQYGLRGWQIVKRALGGACAALALLGIAVFLNRWTQIPFLTGSPTLTALIVGVLSGSAGPSLVVGILERFATRFSGQSAGPDTAPARGTGGNTASGAGLGAGTGGGR